MPDTVTSLPGARPPASENSAWYRTAVANDTSRSGDKPTRMTSTIRTAPMNPALISPAPRYLSIRVQLHLPASDLNSGATTVLPCRSVPRIVSSQM